MGRPLKAANKGMRYTITRMARELEMATKKTDISVAELSSAAAAYRRLLNKAIRCASPSDAGTIQRIGAGLSALTRAVSTVERVRNDREHGLVRPVVCPLD